MRCSLRYSGMYICLILFNFFLLQLFPNLTMAVSSILHLVTSSNIHRSFFESVLSFSLGILFNVHCFFYLPIQGSRVAYCLIFWCYIVWYLTMSELMTYLDKTFLFNFLELHPIPCFHCSMNLLHHYMLTILVLLSFHLEHATIYFTENIFLFTWLSTCFAENSFFLLG